jgi:hypothetical protein
MLTGLVFRDRVAELISLSDKLFHSTAVLTHKEFCFTLGHNKTNTIIAGLHFYNPIGNTSIGKNDTVPSTTS